MPREDGRRNGSIAPKDHVRDPLAVPEAVIAARERSMAERLELAISWNMVASQLRAGVSEAKARAKSGRR